MNRVTVANVAALGMALILSALWAYEGRAAPSATEHAARTEYRRIVSASTVADRLLLELCAREDIVAVTGQSAEGSFAARFVGFETIDSLDRLERIVALSPDLVLTHNVGDPRRVARLEEAGLTVVDLGTLDGRASLFEDIRQVAALCGAEAEGAVYARRLRRRLDAVALGLPYDERLGALYVSVYADRFYGGARGTSYRDILEAAGLRDVSGERTGWPQYGAEELLQIDPPRIVTREGGRHALCDHAVLRRLSACPDGVLELPGDLLDSPGPGMLDAAEALHDLAYPAAEIP
ncbi:MAG: ABC transporter substrate-binding protein [Sandaracinaceae bacterium]